MATPVTRPRSDDETAAELSDAIADLRHRVATLERRVSTLELSRAELESKAGLAGRDAAAPRRCRARYPATTRTAARPGCPRGTEPAP